MARPLLRSSHARTAPTSSRWLPENLRAEIFRLAAMLRGGITMAGAGILAVVLLSYAPQDPSWNTATTFTGATHNWLGMTGSLLADAVHQSFGAAGYLFAIMLAAWGWRIAKGRGLDHVTGRVIAGLVAALTAGTGLVSLFPHADINTPLWGGAIGKILAIGFLHWVPSVWGNAILAVIMALVAVSTLYMASALALEEWHTLLKTLHQVLHWCGQQVVDGCRTAWRFLQSERVQQDEDAEEEPPVHKHAPPEEHDDDEEEEEEPKPAAKVAVKKTRGSPQLVQRPTASARQTIMPLHAEPNHTFPPLELLQWPETTRQPGSDVSEEALERNAKLLESVLADFGVHGQILKVSPGPVVTLYELEPSPGTRAARVIALADDIARNMSATSVRVAVVPGRNVIGIELPNARRETVFLRELLSTAAYNENKSVLPLVLGKDIAGMPVIADLARMPHLLIAGTTGSGKSVAINTMILSLLYRLPPQKCRFIMIDPKMLELSVYEGIPHLLAPVVTDSKKAIMALKWTVREMEERYSAMSKLGVRGIEGYNMRLREAAKNGEKLMRTVQTGFDRETGKPIYEEQELDLTELPYIVVIVDEMADLMIVAGKEIEGAVQRLAQMARAAGIHIMMATQRPSVDVITGTIRANFPTRISFQVTSKIDSRTILNEQGAEQLLGMGDLLYASGGGRTIRVHGPFVRDDEVEGIVKFLKAQGEPEYLAEVTEGSDGEGGSGGDGGDFGGGGSSGDGGSNDLYDKAVDIVQRERKASISFVQRHLQIGYNRAATLIERMEREGVISSANHVGKREVLGRRMEEA